MPHIAIISASVRTGRRSHRVAQYFEKYFEENSLATTEIIDLKAYNFPLFEERLKYMPEPSADVLEYSERIRNADGILIVTPEYNGGYPASLKNAIDILYDDWNHKPVAISTVSDGVFGGSQVITSIQFTLWKMHAMTIPAMFPVPNVNTALDENGIPADKAAMDKRAKYFTGELLWYVEAKKRMDGSGE